jgi:hypothetical protein
MLSFRFIVAYNEKKTMKTSSAIVKRINLLIPIVKINKKVICKLEFLSMDFLNKKIYTRLTVKI